MAICKDCKKSFKSERGVKQHKRNCPGLAAANNNNNSNEHFDKKSLEISNDILDFKTHINTIINSFGETFYLEFQDLQKDLKDLKGEIVSKLEQNKEQFSEIEKVLVSQEEKIDKIKINEHIVNIPPTQTPPISLNKTYDQTPKIRNAQTPDFSNAVPNFEFPKRPVPVKNIEKNKIDLSNRFTYLRNVNDHPARNDVSNERSWSPDKETYLAQLTSQRTCQQRKSPQPFINRLPENEKHLQKPKVVPGMRSYSEAVDPSKTSLFVLWETVTSMGSEKTKWPATLTAHQ